MIIQQFLTGGRTTNIKDNPLANYKEHGQSSEPIKARSKYGQPAESAEKRFQARWLDAQLVRVFLSANSLATSKALSTAPIFNYYMGRKINS